MKKTGATIFTLALALILVSSLSSGVLLADDDDHDRRNKNKNKYHTVYDVVILGCSFNGTVAAVDSTDAEITAGLEALSSDSCSAALAFLISSRFRQTAVVERVGFDMSVFLDVSIVNYTMVRKTRVRNTD